MKKIVSSAVAALTFVVSGAVVSSAIAGSYPTKEVQGIIQWGAGGSTDTVMRSVTPHAEKALGGTIVMQNMTGAVGAIALNHVADSEADGYKLMMGAENPMLYKVMGLGDKDYSEFIPINLLARGTPMLVANNDAPFNTYGEMLAYIAKNPGKVKIGSTGPGGLPSVITAMMEAVEGDLDIIPVPYNGDGPALTALQGGAIHISPVVLGLAIEGIRAGKMKPLLIFDTEKNQYLPDVPIAVKENAGYSTYLPWGPFFGVFVKKGTPNDIVTKLQNAYAKGVTNPDFVSLMESRGFTIMNMSGSKAQAFLTKWQQGTVWLLQDAGLTKTSPAKFGIARPKK